MDAMFPVDLVSRWLHIGTAIVLVGGTVFLRAIVLPSAESLSEQEHDALRDRMLARWRRWVGLGIGLLLISGLYNFMRALPHHRGDGPYHAMFGTKFLLALVVFFLASVMVGRSPAFEKFRQQRKYWLSIVIALAAIIVGISGIMKVRGPVDSPGVNPPAEQTFTLPANHADVA